MTLLIGKDIAFNLMGIAAREVPLESAMLLDGPQHLSHNLFVSMEESLVGGGKYTQASSWMSLCLVHRSSNYAVTLLKDS